MRRVIFLCAFFMGSFVFACDNPLNKMLHNVKELIQAGNHSEAVALLEEIIQMDIGNFTEQELLCYNSTAQELNWGPQIFSCTTCSYTTSGKKPKECPVCHNTKFITTPAL